MTIVLTKDNRSFNFSKKEPGDIRINLNWNQKRVVSSWFGLRKKEIPVDLDLGCFVRLADGRQFVIQALGNAFGSLSQAPFTLLEGDDRTGDVEDGEWITINGNRAVDIDEILIYAFVYSGDAKWVDTNGKVEIHVPGHPTVATQLTGSGNGSLCAIAKLVQDEQGNFQIIRLDNYYTSQSHLDMAHGWGFSWKTGKK